MRFSNDSTLIATGCNDGNVRVYASGKGSLVYTLPPGIPDAMPVTALRFRPAAASKTKNVLLACTAGGQVFHWHVTSGKCISRVTEVDNQVFCADYRNDGLVFATAGKQTCVRVYDEGTRTVTSTLHGGVAGVTPGHSNRIFSVKFDPNDDNTLLSAGWDNTVQIYDIRTGHAVRSIFGPHICGDALDVLGGVVLTASWRPDEQLQMYDLGSGRLIATVPWERSLGGSKSSGKVTGGVTGGAPCLLYSTAFSKDAAGTFIAAGGSGSNECRVYDRTQMLKSAGAPPPSNAKAAAAAAAAPKVSLVAAVAGLARAVYSIDWDGDSAFAIGGGDMPIRVFDLVAAESSGGGAAPAGGTGGSAAASSSNAFDAGSAVGGAASPKSGILPPQLRGSGRAVGSALAAVRNAADSKDGGDAPPSAAASDVAGATAAIGMMTMEERDASALADYGGKESEPEGSGED